MTLLSSRENYIVTKSHWEHNRSIVDKSKCSAKASRTEWEVESVKFKQLEVGIRNSSYELEY